MTFTRVCTKCKLTKPTYDFYFKSIAQGKLHARCKSCQDAYTKMNRERDKVRQAQEKERFAHLAGRSE